MGGLEYMGRMRIFNWLSTASASAGVAVRNESAPARCPVRRRRKKKERIDKNTTLYILPLFSLSLFSLLSSLTHSLLFCHVHTIKTEVLGEGLAETNVVTLINEQTDSGNILLGVSTGESLVSAVEQDEVLLLLQARLAK
jgi:hypothetical protein